MKNVLSMILITLVATVFAACPATTETGSNTNTNGTGTETEKTTEAILAELDKSASEAWMKKDGKFFEGFLTDSFVGNGSDGRSDKAMVVKGISESPCEIKSIESSDGKVTEIAEGIALHTGKGINDGTCEGKDVPDAYFATLYVKDGDSWKGAYHQTREIPPAADAAKPEEGADKAEGAEEPKKPEEAKKEEAPPAKPNISNDEEVGKALSEVETGLWDAWKKKDTKPFEDALSSNFVEISESGTIDRAAAIKGIAEHKCEVTSTTIADAMATKVTDSVYIFTYLGTASGTCDGKPIPAGGMATTTIFMKDGDAWKPVFHMSTPAMAG